MGEEKRWTVVKHPHADGKPVSYTGLAIAAPENWVGVRALWTHGTYDLGYLRFQDGDYLDEYFALHRPFNAFALFRADSSFVGWYCNVTRPTIVTADEIHWHDLYVDVIVYPDGRTLVLDEDELADSGLSDTDPDLLAMVLSGRDELLQRAADRDFPFSSEPHPAI